MLSVFHELNTRLSAAMECAFPEAAAAGREAGKPLDPQLTPASRPEFGDFQANGALALAKPLGRPPRQIATAICEALTGDAAFAELCLAPRSQAPASSISPCGPRLWWRSWPLG
jgi:arginyl-tRNA synthetase